MIYKTVAAVGPNIMKVDTIEFQGMMWLVPSWIESKAEGWSMPARIICLSTLQHQPPFKEGDHFTLNGPIPEDLFDVTKPAQGGNEFVVIEHPNIRFPYLPELA